MTSKQSWSILCIARKGQEMGIELLAMTDKAKHPKDNWTSDNAELVIKFYSKETVERVCSRLEHNHPQVVDYWEAIDVVRRQRQNIKDFRIQNDLRT